MFLFIFQAGCKKNDLTDPELKETKIGLRSFFSQTSGVSPQVQRVMDELQRQNNVASSHLVNTIVADHGYARWDKSFVQINKSASVTSFSKTMGGVDTIVIVPLVKDDNEMVNAYLEAHLTQEVKINLRTAGEYRKMEFSNSTKAVNEAEKTAVRFMQLTKELYGHTNFRIIDDRLFQSSKDNNNKEKSWITIELNKQTESLVEYRESCIDVSVNTECPPNIVPEYAIVIIPEICYTTKTLCYHWWEESGGGGSGNGSGNNGGNNNGGDGNPGSGGGGTQPGNDDPCNGGGLIVNGVLPPSDCDGNEDPGWMPEIPEEPVSLIDILDLRSADVNYATWLNNNPEFSSVIYEELESDNFSPEAKAIAKIIIDQGANNLLHAEWGESFANVAYNHVQEYYNLCCPGLLQPITGFGGIKWAAETKADYAYYRLKHPEWNKAKCLWEATKESIHTALDVAGMVPVIEEVFDLTNGILYTIQGDGLNASLSYASMLPIAGWAANGVKYARRLDGLKFIIKAEGSVKLVSFGGYNSTKFRKALGIAVGDATKQAHHVLSRADIIVNHEVVQRATQAATNQGFHIDNVLNGIPIATWRNQPNHSDYTNKIYGKLETFFIEQPNADPTECYNKLLSIINEAKQAIVNNPSIHLNDLNF